MALVAAAAFAGASHSNAQVMETDASDGTSATTYDGTSLTGDLLLNAGVASQYTVTTANYMAGQSPVAGSGSFPSSGLNDGVLGAGNAGVTFFAGADSNVDTSDPLGAVPQFTFALTGSTTGYTLSSISTINGYDAYGASLANQDYTVSYSTVAAPTVFTTLATVAYDPFSTSSSAATSSLVTLSDLSAVGVADVRFTFTEDANNSGAADAGSVIRELIVNGTPTLASAIPEPSTYAMMFLGAGALVFIARRKLA